MAYIFVFHFPGDCLRCLLDACQLGSAHCHLWTRSVHCNVWYYKTKSTNVYNVFCWAEFMRITHRQGQSENVNSTSCNRMPRRCFSHSLFLSFLHFLFLFCLSPGESLNLTILFVTPNTEMSSVAPRQMGGMLRVSCSQYSELLWCLVNLIRLIMIIPRIELFRTVYNTKVYLKHW